MKRLVCIIAFVGTLCSQPVLAAQNLSIGFVNMSVLLESAPQARQASENLMREFVPMEQEIFDKEKRLQQMKQEFFNTRDSMSSVQIKARERRILALERDLKRASEDFNELIALRRNDELAKVQDIIEQAVREVGIRDNYDMIFYEGVMFAGERANITNVVLEHLRQTSQSSDDESAAPATPSPQ